MKKVFFTLALLVFTLASYAQSAIPSNCVMSVENFNVKQGKSATFDLQLTNTEEDLTVFQIYFNVPDGFVLSDPATTTRTPGFVIGCKNTTGSTTRFMVTGYHDPNQIIPGTSGALVTLTLTAPASAVVGNTYDITWDNAMMSNMSNQELEVPDGSFTVTIAEDALDLYDDATTLPAASTESKVIIHRSFEANKWNSFVAPFAISEAQYKAAFGDDVQVAVFSDQNIDDSENEISIAFTTVTETDANTPVIVMPSAALTQVAFEGTIDIAASEDDAVVQVGKKQGKVDTRSYMYGVYTPQLIKGDANEWAFPLYLTNNKFWYAPAAGVTIKGYRAYLVMTENPTAYTDQYEVKMYIDEDLTAINGVEVDRTNGKVYTVDGKYVGKDVNRMQKGVYIVNGKKVIK